MDTGLMVCFFAPTYRFDSFTLVAGYKVQTQVTHPQMMTHTRTDLVQHRIIALIKSNALQF